MITGMSPRLTDTLSLLARILVGGIFLLAGITKVGSPGLFADAIRAYHLLPGSLVLPFALILPWIELLAAAYLLLGFLTRIGAALCALMLVMFIYALLDSLVTGNINHTCGCFGENGANPIITLLEGGNTIGWWDPIRDAILLLLCGWLFYAGPGPFSVEWWLASRREDEDSTLASSDDLAEEY